MLFYASKNHVIYTCTTVVSLWISDGRGTARSDRDETREENDGRKMHRSENRELYCVPWKSIKSGAYENVRTTAESD